MWLYTHVCCQRIITIIDTTRLNHKAELICNSYIVTIKERLMKWIENEKKDNESVLLPVINQVEEFFNGK